VNFGFSQLHISVYISHISAEISETVKRVPNYSSLTARESLENLRRRQQMQQPQIIRQRLADIGAADFIEVDGTYDTINYDLIRVSFQYFMGVAYLVYCLKVKPSIIWMMDDTCLS
jgi:hypothetical protein